MRAVHDYAFDRVNLTQAVSINLDLNDIERFGDKSFCMRTANLSEISNLDLSYSTVTRLDKCLFKQLQSSLSPRVSLNIGLYMQSLNASSNVCNCEFKNFIREFKIDLIGGCSLLAKTCETATSNSTMSTARLCNDKTQFECISI